MSDLIDRQNAIERIESEYKKWGEEYDVMQILGDLEDLPSAEPEYDMIYCQNELTDDDIKELKRQMKTWKASLLTVEPNKHEKTAQQWIPCSERLPEENEMVLISAKYIGHLSQNDPYVEEGYLSHDGWYSAYGDNYSELLAKVVAWMPLPEPYREVEHE